MGLEKKCLSIFIFSTLFGVTFAAGEDQSVSITVEEIIVTSTRVGQVNLQETPLSISSFNGDDLSHRNLNSIEDIAGFVPGLEVSANANIGQLTLRGIGSNTTLSGGETSSTVQVDGVYMARPSATLFSFLDVERVEVLRGPQGTLYGRNATGGTINIISKKPTNSFEGEARVSAGTYNSRIVEGTIRGPILDNRITASLAMQKSVRDGFVKNVNPNSREDIGELDRIQMRGQLRFYLDDQSELTVAAHYSDIDETMLYYAKPLSSAGIGESVFRDLHTVSVDFDPEYYHDTKGLTATYTRSLSDRLLLTSITGQHESSFSISADLDATEIAFLRTDPLIEEQSQFSQEFQLNYSGENISVLGGLHYFQEDVDSTLFLKLFPLDAAQFQGRDTGTDALSFFMEGTYSWSENLFLTAGLRYTDEEKDGRGYGGFYGLMEGPSPVEQFENIESVNFESLTPKIALHNQFTKNLMLYGSVTKGFKAGGFNYITTPGEDSAFDEESVWAFETGLKSTLFDDSVNLNLAVFRNNYSDLQVLEFIGAGSERVRNAADATIKGVEMEFQSRLSENLELGGFLAYLDAIYDKSYLVLNPILGDSVDAGGKRLNNAPKWSASVFGQYTWRLPTGALLLRGSLAYKDEVFYSASNNQFERQDRLALADAGLSYVSSNESTEVSLNVQNIADKNYISGAAFFLSAVGRPELGRVVSGTLSLKF